MKSLLKHGNLNEMAFNKIQQTEAKETETQSSSWEDNVLLDGPALRKKLDLLVQEKEINDQITNKIKLENENLKDQVSKNQIDLINKQKIIETQNNRIKSHNIDNNELEFTKKHAPIVNFI